MKKSGLDELEALNLDWNPKNHFTVPSLFYCDEGALVFSPNKQSELFNSNKKIQESLDAKNPFLFQGFYGYLR